jgi:chromosome segregation ATPase
MNTQRLNELAERLMEIPQQISDLQTNLMDLNLNSQKLSNSMSEAESILKIQISNMIDENGKKLYSNAESRSAAFIEISKSDDEIQSISGELQDIQLEIQKLKIDIEIVSNEQRNIRSILHFFSNNTTEEL